ncbi:MAG: hypothetical protein OEZ22_08895 [Spirochaetia bacterium]|nr:hypothetical protein [Spirochaetia bacterium]
MQLTTREKIFIIAGGGILFLLLSFLGIKAIRQNILDIDVQIEALKKEEKILEDLGLEYQKLQGFKSDSPANIDNMVPRIEGILTNLGLKPIATLSSSDNPIENKFIKRQLNITFRETEAEQIMQFIKQIENDPSSPYKIEEFTARKIGRKPGMYYFNIKVAGYKKK